MRSFVLAAAVGLSLAAPAPQNIDFDMVDSVPAPTTVSVPIGVTAETVSYTATAILADALSQITSTIAAVTLSTEVPVSIAKRSAAPSSVTSGCATAAVQPTGAGPVPSPDTASAFLGDAYFSSVAGAAPTPAGYTNTFSNLQGSNKYVVD